MTFSPKFFWRKITKYFIYFFFVYFSEMIGIVISDEAKTRISQIRKTLAEEIESKIDPTKLQKYNGYALISEMILIRFKSGKPTIVLFNDEIVGTATLSTGNDVVYPIDKQYEWMSYLARGHDFFLSVGNSDDGWLGGYFARVFGSKEDFTDYATW
jgi:hypothetical protein